MLFSIVRDHLGIVLALLAVYIIWSSTYLGIRPALATSYAYVNPAVAVGLGVGLAGEQITPFGIVAMFVILSSVALLALKRRKV